VDAQIPLLEPHSHSQYAYDPMAPEVLLSIFNMCADRLLHLNTRNLAFSPQLLRCLPDFPQLEYLSVYFEPENDEDGVNESDFTLTLPMLRTLIIYGGCCFNFVTWDSPLLCNLDLLEYDENAEILRLDRFRQCVRTFQIGDIDITPHDIFFRFPELETLSLPETLWTRSEGYQPCRLKKAGINTLWEDQGWSEKRPGLESCIRLLMDRVAFPDTDTTRILDDDPSWDSEGHETWQTVGLALRHLGMTLEAFDGYKVDLLKWPTRE
jgi:hypothetical protein